MKIKLSFFCRCFFILFFQTTIFARGQPMLASVKSQNSRAHGWLTLLVAVINNDTRSGIWNSKPIVFHSICCLLGFPRTLMGLPYSHGVIILSIIKQLVHLWKRISHTHLFPLTGMSFSELPRLSKHIPLPLNLTFFQGPSWKGLTINWERDCWKGIAPD